MQAEPQQNFMPQQEQAMYDEPMPTSPDEPMPAAAQGQEEDEFDYSDFELEDEDI